MQLVDEWRTDWELIPAEVWNEVHVGTAPEWCRFVLYARVVEPDESLIMTMGFALSDDVMRDYTMDEFIAEVGTPELLEELSRAGRAERCQLVVTTDAETGLEEVYSR